MAWNFVGKIFDKVTGHDSHPQIMCKMCPPTEMLAEDAVRAMDALIASNYSFELSDSYLDFDMLQHVTACLEDMFDFFEKYEPDYLLANKQLLQLAINRYNSLNDDKSEDVAQSYYEGIQTNLSDDCLSKKQKLIILPRDIEFIIKARQLRHRGYFNIMNESYLLQFPYPRLLPSLAKQIETEEVINDSKTAWQSCTSSPYTIFDINANSKELHNITSNNKDSGSKITVDMLVEDIQWFKALTSLYTKEQLFSTEFLNDTLEKYKKFLVDSHYKFAVALAKSDYNSSSVSLDFTGPEIDVDLFWHSHLMYREAYNANCRRLLRVNKPITHEPLADYNANVKRTDKFFLAKGTAVQLNANWSQHIHSILSNKFKKVVLLLLIINTNNAHKDNNNESNTITTLDKRNGFLLLPNEILFLIIAKLAAVDLWWDGFDTVQINCSSLF